MDCFATCLYMYRPRWGGIPLRLMWNAPRALARISRTEFLRTAIALFFTVVAWALFGTMVSYADGRPRSYAVLSLIGETMSVVGYTGDTGSQRNQNRYEPVSLGSQLFDTTALGAVQQSLKTIDPEIPVALFLGKTPDLFLDQSKLFEGQRVILPQDVVTAMKQGGATHLFLITRYRSPALITGERGHYGSGMLEGLGYYIDNDLVTTRSDIGTRGRGFLAPFVYLRICLVDLGTSLIEREKLITWSVMFSAARSETGSPRDILPGKRLQFLTSALTREMTNVVPALVVSANDKKPLDAVSSVPGSVERPVLKIGDSWTYRNINYNNQKITGGFTLEVVFANEHAIQTIVTKAGHAEGSDATYTADWNQVSSAEGAIFTPDRDWFRFPLSVGQAWHAAYRMEVPQTGLEISNKREAKVIGWEDVTVPAGRFHALRVELAGTFERSDARGYIGDEKEVLWYVPEVKRFVKVTFEGTHSISGQASSWTGEELVEYKIH